MSPSRKSTANITQLVSTSGLHTEAGPSGSNRLGRGSNVLGKPPTPMPQRSTRVVNSREQPPSLRQINLIQTRNFVRTPGSLNRTDNAVKNVQNKNVSANASRLDHTYDLDVVENGDSCSSDASGENGTTGATGKS